MMPYKRVKEFVKRSKGPATAKGKLVDYKEAHTLQYGFFKGLVTVRPSSYKKSLKANNMALDVWEASEGQYHDTALTAGFITNKILLAGASGFLVL